jgi:hypothetical protein
LFYDHDMKCLSNLVPSSRFPSAALL